MNLKGLVSVSGGPRRPAEASQWRVEDLEDELERKVAELEKERTVLKKQTQSHHQEVEQGISTLQHRIAQLEQRTSTLNPATSNKTKMNTSVINSSLQFNHSSSGSSLPLGNVNEGCKYSLGEVSFDFIVTVFDMVVGYPANIMVMWLVSRKKSDSSTSDIFIFNLAIADALYCTMGPISCVGYYLFKINFFKLTAFTYGIKDCTPLFLTCICLDRYLAVVHPIVFSSIRDNKIRVAISMLIWGFALPFAISRALALVGAPNILSGLVLTTFAIMIFCNISITWSLRKSVFGKEKMHPMKKKALRTVLIALAIIVFHYLPVVTILPITLYYYFPEYCHIERAAFVLKDLSSSTEPLIYISKMEQLPCFNNLPFICC